MCERLVFFLCRIMPFRLRLCIIWRHLRDGNELYRFVFVIFFKVLSSILWQRLLKSVSPSHGRVLIYVWAIEQDSLSKRNIPVDGVPSNDGQDVFVPWTTADGKVYNRYYHMFAQGELSALVQQAADEVGERISVVQDGWERSNYYVEVRLGS